MSSPRSYTSPNIARRYALVAAFMLFCGCGWWWCSDLLRWLEDRRIYWQSLVILTAVPAWSCHHFALTPTPFHPPGPVVFLLVLLVVLLLEIPRFS